jgi:hypothetical protein
MSANWKLAHGHMKILTDYAWKRNRKEAILVDIQLLLFDSMIEPILTYGSKVCGYDNLKFIEQIHLKFCLLDFDPPHPLVR